MKEKQQTRLAAYVAVVHRLVVVQIQLQFQLQQLRENALIVPLDGTTVMVSCMIAIGIQKEIVAQAMEIY